MFIRRRHSWGVPSGTERSLESLTCVRASRRADKHSSEGPSGEAALGGWGLSGVSTG